MLLFGCVVPQTKSTVLDDNSLVTTKPLDELKNNNLQNDGVGQMTENKNIVETGDTVKVHYTGTSEGKVFDSSKGGSPLEFVAGAGQMIKGFDAAVIGMKVGETKTVILKPSDAYGEINPSAIIEVPLAEFQGDSSQLKVGSTVSDSYGRMGTILEKTDKIIRIDFNHRLAGKTLTFEIEMVEVVKK